MIPDNITFQPLLGITNAIVVAEFMIRIGLSIRIIMRRLSSGSTLSWLLVVLALPFGGAALYLFIGESRLGRRRARRENGIQPFFELYLTVHRSRAANEDLDPTSPSHPAIALADSLTRLPVLGGNDIELLDPSEAYLERLVADIDAAERSVHMVSYIWDVGGKADAIAESVMRAARRGVRCRVAVDAIGSARFLKDPIAGRMRDAGVDLIEVLPVGILRALFVRADHRNHRKIVVIDGLLAYTGSMNVADPRIFKKGADGYGPWVDAMLRIQGPIVESFDLIFLQDWEIERGPGMDEVDPLFFFRAMDLTCPLPAGDSFAQVIPSGPGRLNGSAHLVLVSMIYAAQHEVVMTTPYFVPDLTVQTALVSAARRGVDVKLVVPRQVDSRLVHYASMAFFDELVEAGVSIHLFREGLIHTKSITIDGRSSLFGTLNLDPRSFWLNFELMLLIDDAAVTGEIRDLQLRYIAASEPLDAERWKARPAWRRLVENVVQIFSPLL